MAAAGGERGRTSFQRRPGAGPRPPALPGTRPSLRHGQLLLSSGLPSLDCVLGGGIAVGTLLLIAMKARSCGKTPMDSHHNGLFYLCPYL